MTLAKWIEWRADEYFLDYYSEEVQPDEKAAIRFQIEFLRAGNGRFQRAIEYGCGPTLMRAIAAAPYVGTLDMADYLESNLRRVRQWAANENDADDWRRFTRYVLLCEGEAEPNEEDVVEREEMTRCRVRELLVSDALRVDPLGAARSASYDLLVSGFCVDCISRDRDVWRKALRHVMSLLKPGGAFVILSLEGCTAYRVADAWFPAANVRLPDLENALVDSGADSSSMHVTRCALPSHAAQGYEGILLASGQRRG